MNLYGARKRKEQLDGSEPASICVHHSRIWKACHRGAARIVTGKLVPGFTLVAKILGPPIAATSGKSVSSSRVDSKTGVRLIRESKKKGVAGHGRACQNRTERDREFGRKRRWLGKERTLGGIHEWMRQRKCNFALMNPTCVHFNHYWRSTLSARQVPRPRVCSCLACPRPSKEEDPFSPEGRLREREHPG